MLTLRQSAVATSRALYGSRGRAASRSARYVGAAGQPELPPVPPLPSATGREGPYAAAARLGPALTRTSATGGAGPSSSQQQRFGLHRVGGDGACMFRAIAQGAHIASNGKPMPVELEGAAAHALRLAVVQELRQRREEMEPFLPGIATDFDEYCRTMSQPMAWGGEPEMAMAVHVVQRPITVYHLQGSGLKPIVTYGEDLLGSTPPIPLLWSGAHYDLLLPAAGAASAA